MTQNKKIAITGGIGTGKSAVCALLKARGYPVFSCDEIYAEMAAETPFLEALSRLFPRAVRGGRLDRAALSKIVFEDESKRKALNAFTHPKIYERLFSRMALHPVAFAEVPLLFESGGAALFDGTIVLLREKEARIAAVKARDGLSEAEIERRMARQFDYASLPETCFLLRNDGDLSALDEALGRILKALL